MKRKSLKELKSLIKRDILFSQDFLDGTHGSENPQVKVMRTQEQSRLDAMNDILKYIENDER